MVISYSYCTSLILRIAMHIFCPIVYTYTILGLKNAPYSSSSAWGVSKWSKVTKGVIPARNVNSNLEMSYSLTDTFRTIVNNLFKENFYGKRKKSN